MPHFNHDGITFHYLDEGDGLPFVFQHGLGGDVSGPAEVYRLQFGVRYVSMDARGHGATSALGNPADFRFDVLADDLVALLDHLGIEQAVAGGISMGAGEALNLALRHPARVRGLILVRPAWLAEPSPPSAQILAQMGDWIQQVGVDGAPAIDGIRRVCRDAESCARRRRWAAWPIRVPPPCGHRSQVPRYCQRCTEP
ncbi:MAG: alpha/beta fold hydrolase [Anaerolineales bacterium]|nr:alpha/beta fold hydrolase [Anaerolineales bacterium]